MKATEIASRLAAQCEAVCQHLLPLGRQHGADWCCGSLGGEPGNSLKIRLTGSKAGVWADFGGSGDDRGDLIGLWQRVRNTDLHGACEEAMDWLNVPTAQREAHSPNEYHRPISTEPRAPSDTWIRLQQRLRRGTITELSALADLRRIPNLAGLQLATDAGHLWFADVFDDGFDWPAWIITDGSRRNAQARRMDGKPWSGIGDKKAKTIAGSEANWPIGIPESGERDIALVEGGPDFLAAWHFIWIKGEQRAISPVSILGASNAIHADALPLFRGKTVWIFPHVDDNRAGAIGAANWRDQLLHAGAAHVTNYIFGPGEGKDLNDLIAAEPVEDES